MATTNNNKVIFFGNTSSAPSTSSAPLLATQRCVNTETQEIIWSPGMRLRYVLDVEGKVWFPGKETALMLDYKGRNGDKAIRVHIEATHPGFIKSLEDILAEYTQKGHEMKCQGVSILDTRCQSGYVRPDRRREPGTFNKNQLKTKYINEAGFYKLAMNSKLPAAIQFQRWVCEEVLPAIRRTGTYSVVPSPAAPEAPVAVPTSATDPEIEDLQPRMDALSVTKIACDVLKANVRNAPWNSYALMNDKANIIALGRPGANNPMNGKCTAIIKREHHVPKGMSLPDVMNDDALFKRMMGQMCMSRALYRKGEMTPDELSHTLDNYEVTLTKSLSMGMLEGDHSGLIPIQEAKARKKRTKKARKDGLLLPSQNVIEFGTAAGAPSIQEFSSTAMTPRQ